jgi:hypothetical protein
MSIVEQCIAVAERGAEIAFVEFARLAQEPEMVERVAKAIFGEQYWDDISRETNAERGRYGPDKTERIESTKRGLAALFREAGVSGGGG